MVVETPDGSETWEQFLIWLGMQFPVLAAAFFVARWFLNRAAADHDKYVAGIQAQHAKLIAEKDQRLSDRDNRINELKAEVGELKAKLSRSPKKKDDGDQL